MINIIRNTPSADELAKIFADYSPINLLPPIGDPAWRKIRENPVAWRLAQPICEQALAELDTPMPVLTDELYADFMKTGQRLAFETLYFERRRRVARAAVASLLVDNTGQRNLLTQSLIRKVTDVVNEVSWAFPAHVRHEPSGKDPMTIDLFAAETANLCGELLNVFGAVLPLPLQATMRSRLKAQFFDNYLAKQPSWATIGNNWNAVCHQGVLGAALAVSDDAKQLGQLFHKASENLKFFLAGFTADGGSSEGPGYWSYGFGWFMELNHQLENRTRGRLSLVEGDPHVRAIAAFGPRMMLANGYVVNFSDNSARSTPAAQALQYLGDRFDDPFIRASAEISWQRMAVDGINLNEQRGDFLKYSRLLLRFPAKLGPMATLPDVDLFLPDLGVAVIRFHDGRGRLWEFAGKGGHNDEHHNHNDVGSYLLNIDGERLLTEVGQPEYTRQFFSAERYTFFAARSMGHPVPLINGQEQPAYKKFTTPVLKQEFTPTKDTLRLDLTPAYPPEAGCSKCIRAFELDKPAGRLRVTDTIDLTKVEAVESALITESPVTLQDGMATIMNQGIRLRITPDAQTTIREVETHVFRTHSGKDANAYRIVLVPKQLQARVAIGCVIEVI